MSEPSDVVLAYWSEHRQQLRQSETQRSQLTNYILVIVAALTGLAVQQKLQLATAPIAVVITLLGLYGALTSAKYHERAVYHLSQARALTATLKDLGVLPGDDRIVEYRQSHYQSFPRLHKIRMHWLWTGMHLAVAVYGLVLAGRIALLAD